MEETALSTQVGQMLDLLRAMAAELAAQRAETEELKKELRLMVPISTAQEKLIKEAMSLRAETLCRMYGIQGKPKVVSAIRKGLRTMSGANALRDMPRCDFEVYLEAVQMWEDYKTLKKIKEGEKA